MIGSTNLGGGGGVGSDELTATAANVLENTTYVGADTDDELAEGTMINRNKMQDAPGINDSNAEVPVHVGSLVQMNKATDGATYLDISPATGYYESGGGTYVGGKIADVNSAIGLTAGKILAGQSAGTLAGTATSDANAANWQIASGATAYVNGSKITGTLVERGQAQYGNFGSGNGYVAINALPEGIYRSNGANWAPEARIATSTLASGIGLNASVIKKGVSILGIMGTFEGWVSDTLLLFSNGTWSNLSTTGISYLGVSQDSYLCANANAYVDGGNLCFTGKALGGDNGYFQITARLNQSFNLTGYNYLKFYYAGKNEGSHTPVYATFAYVSSGNNDIIVYTSGSTLKNSGTGVLNISSLSGYYWIYFGAVMASEWGYSNIGQSYAYISQLYLSKY